MPRNGSTNQRFALTAVLVNSLLMVIAFTPVCLVLYRCIALQWYFHIIGFPTSLAISISPDSVRSYPHVFMVAYIVNIVAVSYIFGHLAFRLLVRRADP